MEKKGARGHSQVSLGIKVQWRRATEEEVLQEELRTRLVALGRTEHLRKKKRKEDCFFPTDPFMLVEQKG